MKRRQYRQFAAAICGAAILMAAILFFTGSAAGLKETLRDSAAYVIKPAAKAAAGMERGFRGIFRFKEVTAENDKLKEENEKLRQKIRELNLTGTEKYQLEQLAQLFDYEVLRGETILAANVINLDPSAWQGNFTIDQGSQSGIRKGCSVVSEGGLVGKITEVSRKTATVSSFLADNMKVSVQMKSGDLGIGILQSSGNGRMSGWLSSGRGTVRKGSRLVTSGMGIYPAGLDIGTVIKSEEQKEDQKTFIEAVPGVSFFSLKKVGILL